MRTVLDTFSLLLLLYVCLKIFSTPLRRASVCIKFVIQWDGGRMIWIITAVLNRCTRQGTVPGSIDKSFLAGKNTSWAFVEGEWNTVWWLEEQEECIQGMYLQSAREQIKTRENTNAEGINYIDKRIKAPRLFYFTYDLYLTKIILNVKKILLAG